MDLCSFFPLSLPSSPRLNPGNSRPSIKILCSASLPPPPLSFQPPSAASGLAGRPTAVHADGKSRRRSALNRWLRGLALDRRSCQEGTLPLSSTFESPPPPPPPFGGGSKPLLRVFCLQRFLAAALECFSGRPESPEEGGGACVNRRADVQDQEKHDAHASEEEEEEELKEEEEEERRTGDDEGKPPRPPSHPNNHDLHRNEKAVPASSEEMTRRCFW